MAGQFIFAAKLYAFLLLSKDGQHLEKLDNVPRRFIGVRDGTVILDLPIFKVCLTQLIRVQVLKEGGQTEISRIDGLVRLIFVFRVI